MRLAPGTRLGPYEIIGLLGAGGMGEVYRARDTRILRDIAIKVLPAVYSQDPERLRRFELEARSAGALNHPNIISIYDVGSHEGSPYVVSELLEGKTLRQLQEGKPLPQRKAIDLALQVANGLAAANDKRVVHRDLKPENLFITKDGRLKILDFGLAKLTHPNHSDGASMTALTTETRSAVVLGTVGYMSPEQVRGQLADHRSDIFSLGAVLYEMLSGQRAFKHSTRIGTLNAILNEDPPKFPESSTKISPGIEKVMRSCLEKDAEHRFQSARDLALALEAVSGSTGSSAVMSSAPARRSIPRAALYAAMALLPIVAAIAFFTGRNTVNPAPLAAPAFRQLTFRRGTVRAARFAPDGNTIVYSAEWGGEKRELFSTFRGSLESRSLGISDANILSISSTSEMAIRLSTGTLATLPLGGGAPRELEKNVAQADYGPDGKSMAVVRVDEGKISLQYPRGKVLYEAGVILYPRVSHDGSLVAFVSGDASPSSNLSLLNVVDITGRSKTLNSDFVSIRGLAWSPDGREIWFRGSNVTGDCICAVSLSGKLHSLLWSVPGRIRTLYDVSKDGDVLFSQGIAGSSINGVSAGETTERDLSWFFGSALADLSEDGQTILFREFFTASGEKDVIYLRKMDGSPAVRLGQGFPLSLTPGGKSVLVALTSKSPLQLALLPTGLGQQTVIRNNAKLIYEHADEEPMLARMLANGKTILFAASEPSHKPRLFIQNLDEGRSTPVTPEGVSTRGNTKPVSPDGKWVFAEKDGQYMLFPMQGGESQSIRGLLPGDRPIQWTADGHSLYVREGDEYSGITAKIFRLDLSTGHREFWKELVPSDPSGVWYVDPIFIASDGKSYAYSYWRELSDLFLLEGLR